MDGMMNSMTKSWRTTAMGIAAGLLLCLPEIQSMLDEDPLTVFSWEQFGAGLMMMFWGIVGRDNLVKSEHAGAK